VSGGAPGYFPKWLLVGTALAGRLRLPRVRQCRRGVPEEPCGPRRTTRYGRTWDNGISVASSTDATTKQLIGYYGRSWGIVARCVIPRICAWPQVGLEEARGDPWGTAWIVYATAPGLTPWAKIYLTVSALLPGAFVTFVLSVAVRFAYVSAVRRKLVRRRGLSPVERGVTDNHGHARWARPAEPGRASLAPAASSVRRTGLPARPYGLVRRHRGRRIC
jgi:hypothetical protein